MGSWTNATDDGSASGTGVAPPDTRGGLVHPHLQDRIVARAELPIIDPAIARYATHHWSVRWRRHGEPLETSEVITRPVCHLTFEDARLADGSPLTRHDVRMPAAVVTPVWARRFVVRLEGEGRVFGVAFRPGGLAALAGRGLAPNQSLPADDVLPGAAALLSAVLAEPDDEQRRSLVEAWLAPRCAVEPDPDYLLAASLVDAVRADAGIVRVDQIGRHAGLSTRGVQRLFRRYIGATPKWVLVRSRLRDAAARLDADPGTDLAALAHQLGWYDQSHFVRDFRRYLGVTPGQYAREAAADA